MEFRLLYILSKFVGKLQEFSAASFHASRCLTNVFQGFEGDPSMNPLFPRVVPQFSSPFAKMRDGAGEEGNFFGGVIKPVIKKVSTWNNFSVIVHCKENPFRSQWIKRSHSWIESFRTSPQKMMMLPILKKQRKVGRKRLTNHDQGFSSNAMISRRSAFFYEFCFLTLVFTSPVLPFYAPTSNHCSVFLYIVFLSSLLVV